MKQIQIVGLAGVGISLFIILAVFVPIILALIAGCLVGAAMVYAMLLASPATYDEEEQEIDGRRDPFCV